MSAADNAKNPADATTGAQGCSVQRLLRPTWIHADHYHCKCCGAIIECAVALPWTVGTGFRLPGVRRVGVCKCGQILIEHENEKVRWPMRRA